MAARPRAVALFVAFGALLSQLVGSTAATQRQVMPNAHELAAYDLGNPKYYFYNEITNEVQWDDPGGALLRTPWQPHPNSRAAESCGGCMQCSLLQLQAQAAPSPVLR